MKISSTPFSFKGGSYLGQIYRPYIQVLITSQKIDEWVPVEMIVDTGADYTLLPRKYARLLSISLEKECQVDKTYGVGGKEVIYLCKKWVSLKIDRFEKIIPVGFLNRDDIPALLGRLQALEVLKLTMGNMITILEK